MKSAFAYIAQRVGCDGSEVRRTEEAIPGSLETLTERFPVNLRRGNDPPLQNPFVQTNGIQRCLSNAGLTDPETESSREAQDRYSKLNGFPHTLMCLTLPWRGLL